MLSDTAEYALRAALYIAQHQEEDTPLRADDIAEALGVPRNYLSKILHILVKEKVLASARGRNGGFTLRRAADQLNLYTIIQPFDRMEPRRTCLLGRPQCSDHNPCPAHGRWKGISETVHNFFHRTTVADLVRDAAGGKSILRT